MTCFVSKPSRITLVELSISLTRILVLLLVVPGIALQCTKQQYGTALKRAPISGQAHNHTEYVRRGMLYTHVSIISIIVITSTIILLVPLLRLLMLLPLLLSQLRLLLLLVLLASFVLFAIIHNMLSRTAVPQHSSSPNVLQS